MLDINNKIHIFDGAFGTEINRLGLTCPTPEDLNITNPKEIQSIHLSYGFCDFITTNTFGLNKIKYHGKYNIKDVAIKAIENARVTGKKVFFDLGPTGKMMKPLGTISFDEVYDAYKEIVLITKDLVDGYIAETFSDLYEIKACILAIKENSTKPVFATMTFDQTGRTLMGSTPEIVALTLEGLNVDALGVNCSLGPKDLLPTVKELVKYSSIPVIVQPNCGLPKLFNGRTIYSLPKEEYSYYAKEFVNLGVSILGGCCGTNPEYIKELVQFQGKPIKKTSITPQTKVCSSTKIVDLNNIAICGERLNPTGKKVLKEALINQDFDYLIQEGIKEVQSGSDILDINVGVPTIDEASMMKNTIEKLQEFIDCPLQIDSSDKDAVDAGARYYNGTPLINGLTGEKSRMDFIFPILKKYGGAVVALTIDENGVPQTAEDRFAIAKKIIDEAKKYGISSNRIIIDTLTLTASAEQKLVIETIKALTLVKQLGVKTALGVSNVSYGLPNRKLLNKSFLCMSLYAGLNMPIINPFDEEMINTIFAYKVLNCLDVDSKEYIKRFSDIINETKTPTTLDINNYTLYELIYNGYKNSVIEKTNEELTTKEPLDIIDNIIIKALNDVGDAYGNGKLFLPQLISAAEASKKAFEVLSTKIKSEESTKGKIVLATVKGDVHDIGKNICKVLLESYGYNVIDLGKDTPIETIINSVKKYNPIAVGLSALMTTTVKSMADTIKELKANNINVPIFVGGAVLNQEIADEIGANYYTKNAYKLVEMIKEL